MQVVSFKSKNRQFYYAHTTDLDAFFWAGDVLVAEVLEWNKARHGVVKPRPYTDCLARTAARVKVTPHLQTRH